MINSHFKIWEHHRLLLEQQFEGLKNWEKCYKSLKVIYQAHK